MPVVATPLVPSTTNSVGTAFGTFVGGLVVKWLIAAPFVVQLAATPFAVALGLTPMGIAGIGGVLATALGGYAATHIAELQEAGVFLQALQSIKAQRVYPMGKNGAVDAPPIAVAPPNDNFNQDNHVQP